MSVTAMAFSDSDVNEFLVSSASCLRARRSVAGADGACGGARSGARTGRCGAGAGRRTRRAARRRGSWARRWRATSRPSPASTSTLLPTRAFRQRPSPSACRAGSRVLFLCAELVEGEGVGWWCWCGGDAGPGGGLGAGGPVAPRAVVVDGQLVHALGPAPGQAARQPRDRRLRVRPGVPVVAVQPLAPRRLRRRGSPSPSASSCRASVSGEPC